MDNVSKRGVGVGVGEFLTQQVSPLDDRTLTSIVSSKRMVEEEGDFGSLLIDQVVRSW